MIILDAVVSFVISFVIILLARTIYRKVPETYIALRTAKKQDTRK